MAKIERFSHVVITVNYKIIIINVNFAAFTKPYQTVHVTDSGYVEK